ncbi:MAG: phage portal protein [Dehalococcoidia bacterium]|nr:phage portal protein [Dehalococcoidia bacterium]
MTAIPLPDRITSDHETNQRARRYRANRDYYAGKHAIKARTSPGTTATPRNLTALFIDTVTDHMGAARASFGEGAENDVFDQYLTATLAAEDSEVLDYDTEIACATDGDAVWKVTYDDQERRPRIARVAPETFWASGPPDNPTAFDHVAHRYKLRVDDFPALFPDALIASASRDAWITEEWTRDLWRIWIDKTVASQQPNPYGFIPYVHFANWRYPGEAWGRGDGDRIRDLQDRLNHAEADADDVMTLAGAVAVFEGADPTNLSWRPGAMWELPEGARAYLLDLLGNGAMTQRLDYVQRVRERLHDVGRVPASVLGHTARNLSGVALQTELGPLIRLVARKRLTRSAALRRRAQLIVALGAKYDGLPDTAPLPSVTWTEAVPADRADELRNAQSERTLGRDPEAVLRSIGVEDPAAELLAAISWAARGLPGATPNDRTDPNPREPDPAPGG